MMRKVRAVFQRSATYNAKQNHGFIAICSTTTRSLLQDSCVRELIENQYMLHKRAALIYLVYADLRVKGLEWFGEGKKEKTTSEWTHKDRFSQILNVKIRGRSIGQGNYSLHTVFSRHNLQVHYVGYCTGVTSDSCRLLTDFFMPVYTGISVVIL